MAYKALLAFGLADTGITLGALTVDALRDYATNTDHATDWMVGATLENAGQGLYYLVLPAATSEGTVSVHVTADATKWADGVIETVGAIDAILEDTAAMLDAAGVRTAVGLAAANLDTQLAALPTDGENASATAAALALAHGAGSWVASVAGPGASQVTITVNDALGNPVADCEVWATSDEDGDTVVAGTLTTDDDGTVKFLLTAGTTYYIWRRKAGMTFSNPATIVAAGD